MINRADYSDDEWAEVIARSRILGEGHEWEIGEWLWDGFRVALVSYQIYLTRYDPNTIGAAGKRYFEKAIWLARLDQLIEIAKPLMAADARRSKPNFPWMSLLTDDKAELSALRAIQHCGEYCFQKVEYEARSGQCQFYCGGIHPPDGPHRCRAHWQEAQS